MRPGQIARRSIVPLLIASLVALSGCGGDGMSHLKALSTYTPENLTGELLVRFKAAKFQATPRGAEKSKGSAAVVDGDKKPGPEAKEGDAASAHDSPAASKGQSLDVLIRNIAKKAKLIEGTPQPEVFSKMSGLIDADKELSAADKDGLKSRLKEAMGV